MWGNYYVAVSRQWGCLKIPKKIIIPKMNEDVVDGDDDDDGDG